MPSYCHSNRLFFSFRNVRAIASLSGPRAASLTCRLSLILQYRTNMQKLVRAWNKSMRVTTGLQSVHKHRDNGYLSVLLIPGAYEPLILPTYLHNRSYICLYLLPLWCAVLTVSFLFSVEYTRKLLSQCPPVTSSLLLGERTKRWGEIARSWANGPPTYCHFDLDKEAASD